MTINIKAPENKPIKPVITIFGIGGAGGNAVNNMMASNLQGGRFVVANTDAQSLEHSACDDKIQLGVKSTLGLGAGADPEKGREAAEESIEEIKAALEGSNMVFITAGMGGGTGTGAAPVVARVAKEMGILTVAVVTKPFSFEGKPRMKVAEKGLANLKPLVDTIIVIPNQKLFSLAKENTTFHEAFKMADDVLFAGVRSVTDLIVVPGLINLDFADIKTVMYSMGDAMMGTGEASGEDRAIKAAENAIHNPLLAYSGMKKAERVLINISGGEDMTLFEVDAAAGRVREEAGEEADIIFGSTFNPQLKGIIRVSVVATGINKEEDSQTKIPSAEELFPLDDSLPEKSILFNSGEPLSEAPVEEPGEETFSAREDSASFSGKDISGEGEKKSWFTKLLASLNQKENPVSLKKRPLETADEAGSVPSDVEETPSFLRNKGN